ncbi:MAG: gliding motility-associated C-terminal domain-containing protein, partial [Chitinophagaceae bacterium]
IVHDTIRSLVSNCDSIRRTTRVIVHQPVSNYLTACIREGDKYTFNDTALTRGGHYSAVFPRTSRCDSTVHLFLIVSRIETDTVEGCAPFFYKAVFFTKDSVLQDTIRSVLAGCDSVYLLTIVRVHAGPKLITSPNLIICKGSSALLRANAPGSSIYWTDGGTDTLKLVQPGNTTTYRVIAVNTSGCADTGFIDVAVENFQLELSASTSAAPAGSTIYLKATSPLPFRVLGWSPTALFINQAVNTQTMILRNSVMVSVWGITAAGCGDTAHLKLVSLDSRLQVPSAFTPNGDGKNDLFRVSGQGILMIHLQIYNRWGNLVFETRSGNEGWDGQFRNIPQPGAVYVYSLSARMLDGSSLVKKGSLLLLR